MSFQLFGLVSLKWRGAVGTFALALMLPLGAGGCGKSRSSRGAVADASGAPARRAPPRPGLAEARAEVLWRTPFTGAVRVLRKVGGVVVVTSRRRSDRSSARRLAGFGVADGRMLWQRANRVRFFERNAPWTLSVAVVGSLLAVAKTANRVEGLEATTGARRWRVRGAGGVARVRGKLAVADAGTVFLVDPASGKRTRSVSLADPKSGAPGNGLMDGLMPGSRIAAFSGGVLLTRRHGGAVQALDAKLSPLWRYLPADALPGRPDRLVSGRGTVWVPVLRPRRTERTRIELWRPGDRKPGLSVSVPGRVSRKRVWLTRDQLVGLSRTTTRQTVLYRVDRRTGALRDARPFPAPHFCFLGAGTLACKRGHRVSGHDLDTLARRWRFEPPAGRNIRSVRRAGDLLVLEVGRKLVAMTLRDGKIRLEVPRVLDGKPYRVVAALGVAGDTLVLAVRHLEESPWGDRMLLLGLSMTTKKIRYQRRLGRYPRPGALPSGPVREEDTAGRLPLAWGVPKAGGVGGHVLSLFGKVFQVVDGASGRVIFARGIPGQAGHRARLVRTAAGVAVFRRGHTIFGISLAEHRVRWQASLFRVRLETVTGARVYVSHRKRRSRVFRSLPPRAPDPQASGLAAVARLGCRPRWVTKDQLFCQGASKLWVLSPTRGVVLREGRPATNVFPLQGQVVATFSERVKVTRPGAWVGLDASTGKPRFTVPYRRATPGPLPAPFEHEGGRPVRFLTFAAGAFWVSGPRGRCLRGVDAVSGQARPKICFDALWGPPLAWGSRLLVAAPVSPASAGATGEWGLYAVDPATGKRRVIFRPGAGKRVVLGDAPVDGDRLFVSVRPAKRRYRDNRLVALRLH